MKRFSIATFLSLIVLIISGGCSEKSTASTKSATDNQSSGETKDSVQAAQKPAPSVRDLTFAFVGDIMMGTNYPESPEGAYLPANDGKDLFRDAAELLRSADIAAGNLEGTLLDSGGTPKKCSNPNVCYAFRMPTKYVSNLTDVGMDFVGIANNHINDFGPVGLASTKKTLTDAGIAFAGLQAGPRTATLERDGRKIGFAAFGHSKGTMSINDLETVRRTVADLKKSHDIVVVSFHGGAEGPKYSHVPHSSETAFGENRGNVEKFAHTAIDAGADVVYGHGPHVARAAELYKDHLILYSLGNFCTPYRMGLGGISGQAPLVTVTIDNTGKFKEGKIHSFLQQKGTGPRLDPNNSVAKQIKSLSTQDFPNSPLRIDSDGTLHR